MKKVRMKIMSAAFSIATMAGLASTSVVETPEAFGENYMGQCMPSMYLEEGCGGSGFYRCTVYLVETDELVPAYSFSADSTFCALPLWRW